MTHRDQSWSTLPEPADAAIPVSPLLPDCIWGPAQIRLQAVWAHPDSSEYHKGKEDLPMIWYVVSITMHAVSIMPIWFTMQAVWTIMYQLLFNCMPATRIQRKQQLSITCFLNLFLQKACYNYLLFGGSTWLHGYLSNAPCTVVLHNNWGEPERAPH